MQLVFRKFPAGDVPAPAPGEVYVRVDPAVAGQGVAASVLQQGLAALIRGPGPAEYLVVDAAVTHPTLDDMLAAVFAQELLADRKLPEGCRAFADYAAVVRQGLRPADVPPEDSLEGIFLAVRNAAGKDADLTNPATGDRFRKDWARMANCLLNAAAQEINPLTASPFAGRSEFMQERAFLLRDREVYRQDVLRGERWLVRLQGGPEQASGLFLRRPTSLFFPYWSRTDSEAPVGGAYLFLAVHWGEGTWVLSTDPAQRLPIPSLAEVLQTAEAARDGESARRDPWYDGRRPEHGNTLVAAPRGGSKLTEREVLRIVKKWARARPVRPLPWMAFVAAAAVLLALSGLVWAAIRPLGSPPPTSSPSPGLGPGQVAAVDINLEHDASSYPTKLEPQERSLEPRPNTAEWILPVSFSKPYDHDHAARLWVHLEVLTGPPLPVSDLNATVSVNGGPATQLAAPPDAAPKAKTIAFDAGAVTFHASDNRITVRVDNPDDQPRQVACQLEWRAKGKLYVLAVGVSEYADSVLTLKLPRKDALDLVETFKAQKGRIFSDVQARTPLDKEASRDDILKGMKWLKERCTPLDTAVVLLAGHGVRSASGHFVFAPYDFDQTDPMFRGLRDADFLENLGELPCNVLLLLDCCHSGAFPDIHTLNVRKGLMVFAATRSTEQAAGDADKWGHGALTLAVLEGIQNKYLFSKPSTERSPRDPPFAKLAHGEITLQELTLFVSDRVGELTDNKQAFMSFKSHDLAPQQIPIAPQGPAFQNRDR